MFSEISYIEHDKGGLFKGSPISLLPHIPQHINLHFGEAAAEGFIAVKGSFVPPMLQREVMRRPLGDRQPSQYDSPNSTS